MSYVGLRQVAGHSRGKGAQQNHRSSQHAWERWVGGGGAGESFQWGLIRADQVPPEVQKVVAAERTMDTSAFGNRIRTDWVEKGSWRQEK